MFSGILFCASLFAISHDINILPEKKNQCQYTKVWEYLMFTGVWPNLWNSLYERWWYSVIANLQQELPCVLLFISLAYIKENLRVQGSKTREIKCSLFFTSCLPLPLSQRLYKIKTKMTFVTLRHKRFWKRSGKEKFRLVRFF